ncbi:MAG: hypothetical protein K6U09_12585 [Acidobacteriia bacterium]|nr:hypothetical protein [Terriglobia bacterium]
MAIIKYGHLISEARASLNGTVFSRNSAGPYMRAKVSPAQPRTARQQQVRQRLSAASASWRNLTEDERKAWITAAAIATKINVFGDNMPLTGHQLYMRLARVAQELGASILTTPPQIEAPQGLDTATLTATASPAALSLAFTPTPAGTGIRLMIDATDTLSAGISYAGGKYRRILVSAAAATSPVDILSAWQAKFGTLVAGSKVFVRVKTVDQTTMITSPEVIASAIVA